MAKEVFTRHELKFLIDRHTYGKIYKALMPYLVVDQHANKQGYYTVSNIYYDTKDDLFHYEKMKGQDFRQKLRLRTYGHSDLDSESYLEIKKKHKGLVNKRRTALRLRDAYRFLEVDEIDNNDLIDNTNASNIQILKEVAFLKKFYTLEPKVALCYERQAFQGKEDNELRITFDDNLRKRHHNLRLELGSEGASYVSRDIFVLEIKVNDTIPLWLARILSQFSCSVQSFSKYSTSHNAIDTIAIQRKTG